MGILGFVIQIYCDFSGYSDMAIGIALLLGYRFKDNFDSPFKSQNPTEFWRRWHISLSTWLRDYVYIPLGGNRKGKFRTHLNKMTTMVVGGIWHGASWMYLIWGAFQGVLLIGHKSISSIYRAPRFLKNNPITIGFNILITFTLTAIGFVFFRFAISKPAIEDSMSSLNMMTHSLIYDFKPEIASQFIDAYLLIVVAIAAGYILHFTPRSWRDAMIGNMTKLNPVVQAVILAIVLFFIIQIRQSDLVPFVYLQY